MDTARTSTSIVFLGASGSGKSTIQGHLLHLQDAVESSVFTSAEAAGKPKSKFAWVMDKGDERKELRTIRGCSALCPSDETQFNDHGNMITALEFIDTPGDAKFLKNLMAGSYLADAAVIVVSPERGWGNPAYRRRIKHMGEIAQALGIKDNQVVVCINKMDELSFRENHFREFEIIARECLRAPRRRISDIIPISGFTGDNLEEPSSNMSWYRGDTLWARLNSLLPNGTSHRRDDIFQGPLRVPIQQVIPRKLGDPFDRAVGRVASGHLVPCDSMLIGDTKESIYEVEVYQGNELTEDQGRSAYPGQLATMKFRGTLAIKRGMVFAEGKLAPDVGKSFTAMFQFAGSSSKSDIKVGYCPVIFCHTAAVSCRIINFTKLQTPDGKVVARDAKIAKRKIHPFFTAELVPLKSLCLDTLRNHPHLGKVMMSDGNEIIGFGHVTIVN